MFTRAFDARVSLASPLGPGDSVEAQTGSAGASALDN